MQKLSLNRSEGINYKERFEEKLAFHSTISYLYIMKSTLRKVNKSSPLREKILKSLIASFKIEGINIPLSTAEQTLKRIELNLEK